MIYGKEPFFLWFAPKKQLSVYFSPKMGANGKRRAFFYSPPAPLSTAPGTAGGFFILSSSEGEHPRSSELFIIFTCLHPSDKKLWLNFD